MKKTILISIMNTFLLFSFLMSFYACDKDNITEPDTLPSSWIQPNAEDYEYTMTYVSQIAINGVIHQHEETELAAFCSDVCRGKAILKYEESLGLYLCYLTIFSNTASGEVITLNVFDAEKKALYTNVLNLNFVNNETMGAADNVLNCSR